MASTKLGCGEATKKVGNMEKTFFACRYYPAGNYLGAFQNNVHILKSNVNFQNNFSSIIQLFYVALSVINFEPSIY